MLLLTKVNTPLNSETNTINNASSTPTAVPAKIFWVEFTTPAVLTPSKIPSTFMIFMDLATTKALPTEVSPLALMQSEP